MSLLCIPPKLTLPKAAQSYKAPVLSGTAVLLPSEVVSSSDVVILPTRKNKQEIWVAYTGITCTPICVKIGRFVGSLNLEGDTHTQTPHHTHTRTHTPHTQHTHAHTTHTPHTHTTHTHTHTHFFLSTPPFFAWKRSTFRMMNIELTGHCSVGHIAQLPYNNKLESAINERQGQMKCIDQQKCLWKLCC